MADLQSRLAGLSPEKRALLEKRLREGSAAKPVARLEPLAIVGMACRFPGGADTPDAYWRLLEAGTDAVSEVPLDRWRNAEWHDADPLAAGRISNRHGGFLSAIDRFDAAFFGISPREAGRLDPQQRLLLEVAWEAFDDAGLTQARLAGSATGVFVGVHSHSSDYCWLQFAEPDEMDAFTGTGTAHNMLAGRLAYYYDLAGPGVVVDTACSSSLVALHLASQSLRAGECDAALVAGVNVILTPHFTVAASRMHMLAPDGRSKPFDHRADGFVRGEGCGAIVLKRLTDAQPHGDRVRAIVRGSAMNQDGRTNGITAPNGRAQRNVVRAALRAASVDGAEVSYVETHGTGTPLGDPIEIEALGEALASEQRRANGPIWLGSAKANIGHLEGAAGIAGVIKAVLTLEHGALPPLVHFTKANPHLDLARGGFDVPTRLTPWQPASGHRVAGVSSFGWSGTNVHVILEEAPVAPAAARAADPAHTRLLPLSAFSPGALARVAEGLLPVVDDERVALDDLCFTLGARRSHLPERAGLVFEDREELRAGLRALARGEAASTAIIGRPPAGRVPGIVSVFPGQGSQWLGMGRSLLQSEPELAAALREVDAAIQREAGWSVIAELQASPDTSRLAEIDVVQPTLFAMQVALAAFWRARGFTPVAVVGHSMGEVAAAHVAGVLGLDDAVRVICRRSHLLRRIRGAGAMAVVELPLEEARRAVDGFAGLSVAASNSRRSTVISGDPQQLATLVADLTAKDIFCRTINVDVASHSPQVEPLASDLRAALSGLAPVRASLPFYSTVTGRVAEGPDLGPDYWVANLRQPVLLSPVVERLVSEGRNTFIEISPHPILTPAIERDLAEIGGGLAVGSLRREESEARALCTSLATLYVHGHEPDWSRLTGGPRAHVRLPAYPWERQSYWIDARGPRPWRRGSQEPRAASVDDFLWEVRWERSARAGAGSPVPGAWLIVAPDADAGRSLAQEMMARGAKPVVLPAAAVLEGPGAVSELLAGPRDWRGVAVLAIGGSSVASLDARAVERRTIEASLVAAHALQGIVASGRAARLWLLTRGAQPVQGAPVDTALPEASLWGLGRVIAEEHADIWGGLIDLDPADRPNDLSSAAEELLAPTGEHLLAWRGEERWTARFVPRSTSAAGVAWTPGPAATWLITGGLAGVGGEVARWLAGKGTTHFILAGRTALPPRESWKVADLPGTVAERVQTVLELERLGAQVHVAAIDVSDEAAVRSALAEVRERGWPAVRGVVHAAVVADDALVSQLEAGSLSRVVHPKVAGLWSIDRALSDAPPEWLIAFSSLGSVLPQSGQASYAAANAFLDSYVHHARSRGIRALAINWGGWQGLGLAARNAGAQLTIANLASEGMRAFSGAEGLAALERILELDAVQTAVVPIDRALFAQSHWTKADPHYLAALAGAPSQDTAHTAGEARNAPMRDRVLAERPDRRARVLGEHIAEQLGGVLKLSSIPTEWDRPMGALGLESLLALELRNRLERSLGLTLSATVVWSYPTIDALAAFLLKRLVPLEETLDSSEAVPALASAPLALEEMSDDDAMRALLEGGRG